MCGKGALTPYKLSILVVSLGGPTSLTLRSILEHPKGDLWSEHVAGRDLTGTGSAARLFYPRHPHKHGQTDPHKELT